MYLVMFFYSFWMVNISEKTLISCSASSFSWTTEHFADSGTDLLLHNCEHCNWQKQKHQYSRYLHISCVGAYVSVATSTAEADQKTWHRLVYIYKCFYLS